DATEEERREVYDAFMAERGQSFKDEAAEVKELGGLYVVGTERHDSRRIDNQLRGRSGRQGDPGASRFFLSLEDDLMRLFSSDRIASVMDKLGAEEGEVITHSLVTRSIERAQKKVEINNFEIRKRLLEYDDVLNKQREVIYGLRVRALEGDPEEVFEEAREILSAAASSKVEQHVPEGAYPHDWDLEGLQGELARTFLVPFAWLDEMQAEEIGEDLPSTPEEIADRVEAEIRDAFDRRIEDWRQHEVAAEFPPDRVVRHVLLRVIDEKWRDHLYEIDQLRTGIQYRAWGQRDPLIEYKKEAYEMFVEMMDDLQASAAATLLRVQLVQPGAMTAEDRRRREQAMRRQVAMHAAAPAMAGAPAGAAAPATSTGVAGAAAGDPATFVRDGDKVGRNDPCPCGSGKKYKKCHGA
ncbi:MAG TPA: SEC-C metal-binding domain-containing protein, partial [Gemmatimonadota bacterium]|nr:SEC-C metal-binding domain-containing protein [Gemmatimonadota bacterium]